MKIKALWGFIGNARILGAATSKVVAGQVFDDVDDEYGHALVGKGLAEEIIGEGKPKAGKPAAPRVSKPAATRETVAATPIQPELTPADTGADAAGGDA